MKLTAESTVVNDAKINTDIDGAQTTADNAQGTANTAVTKADNAQSTADTAVTKADNAQATANQAKSVADTTAQYFWFTSSGSDTGAHISEKTQEQFESNPSGGNLLARSNGIAVRDGLTELATFGASEARVGKPDAYHLKLTSSAIAQQLNENTTLYKLYGDASHCFMEFLPAYNPDPSTYGTHIEANGADLYMDSYGSTRGYSRMTAKADTITNTAPRIECGQGGAYSTGKIRATHTIEVISDRRLKEHIGYLGDDAVRFVKKLKPAHFKINGSNHVGFYAQDVEGAEEWQALVSTTDGLKSLAYSELIAPLVTYCQHLEKRIEELERSK